MTDNCETCDEAIIRSNIVHPAELIGLIQNFIIPIHKEKTTSGAVLFPKVSYLGQFEGVSKKKISGGVKLNHP